MKTVKINQGLSDFSEPEEGEIYQIVNVGESVAKGYKGISIEFTPKKQTEENKKTQYRITAWLGQNDTVGTRSKLGSFISAFTDYYEAKEGDTQKGLEMAQDTANWITHFVKIVEWKNKNREIKVIS